MFTKVSEKAFSDFRKGVETSLKLINLNPELLSREYMKCLTAFHALASWRMEKPQQRDIFPYWFIWFVPRMLEPFCYSDYAKIPGYFLLLEIIDYFCYRRKNKHINIWKKWVILQKGIKLKYIYWSKWTARSHLFQTKKHTSNWSSKCNRNSCSGCSWKHLQSKCLHTRHELFETPSIQTGKLEI